MKSLRRVLRTLWFLFVLVIVLGATTLAILTLTEPGRGALASLISSMASTETSKVEIGGISGIWSGNLKLDHVVLSDTEGPWLVVRDVEAVWSPFALFSSGVDADSVRAGRIEVARLPKPDPNASDEPFSLPVDLDIRRIDLPIIALGGELAGQVAEISAEGSLKADASPLTIATDLNIARRDGREGTLTASIDFAPNENRLDIEVRGAEPAGGVLANFLRLPGAPPVDIKIAGSGPVSNWKGQGTFAVDGAVVTRLSATHQVTERGRRVEAKGDGEFQKFAPALAQPLLAGQTNFDVAATILNDGGIDIERADLKGTAATASASGQYDPDGASDLSMNLNASNGPIRVNVGSETDPIVLDLSRLTLRAFGAGDAPAVDANVALDLVSTKLVEITGLNATIHSDAFDIGKGTGPVAIDATAATAGSTNEQIASLLAGALTAKINVTVEPTRLTIASATLASGSQTTQVSGVVSREDGSLALNVLSNLLAGVLPPAARPVLGERVAVSAEVSRDAAGAVTAQNIAVRSGDLSATGIASYANETIQATIQGTLAEIGKLTQQASGAIAFNVTASGAASAPKVTATV
ncbi:MAG TPA: translocation/assembly module TamB, partial [Rhizobiaceae bacterium]|nr:translocation/assembly module TamB [Rhizobiaceae bacterium]